MLSNFFSNKQNKQNKPSEDNWVRLRFWIPQGSKATADVPEPSKKQTEINLIEGINDRRLKNVGHVSIETKNTYASIWPDNEEEIAIGPTTQHKIFFMKTPEDDEEAERRPADYTIDLFSLDAKEIDKKFLEIKEKTTKWQLLGRNRFIGNEGQSCSGLTYELLESSGFDKEVPLLKTIKPKYLYTTPASILQMTATYKQLELVKYPETASFIAKKYALDEKQENKL